MMLVLRFKVKLKQKFTITRRDGDGVHLSVGVAKDEQGDENRDKSVVTKTAHFGCKNCYLVTDDEGLKLYVLSTALRRNANSELTLLVMERPGFYINRVSIPSVVVGPSYPPDAYLSYTPMYTKKPHLLTNIVVHIPVY